MCFQPQLCHASLPLAAPTTMLQSINRLCNYAPGAPVGSLVVGPQALVDTARHYRKMYGGGWRQAGQLAAACDYALDRHWPRMAQDHENAEALAQGWGVTAINPKHRAPNVILHLPPS